MWQVAAGLGLGLDMVLKLGCTLESPGIPPPKDSGLIGL